MEIKLVKTDIENAKEIHQMQIITFRPLLEKYQDFGSNPGNEKIEKTIGRLKETITDYYIIKSNDNSVGGIRIRRYKEGNLCKVGP